MLRSFTENPGNTKPKHYQPDGLLPSNFEVLTSFDRELISTFIQRCLIEEVLHYSVPEKISASSQNLHSKFHIIKYIQPETNTRGTRKQKLFYSSGSKMNTRSMFIFHQTNPDKVKHSTFKNNPMFRYISVQLMSTIIFTRAMKHVSDLSLCNYNPFDSLSGQSRSSSF